MTVVAAVVVVVGKSFAIGYSADCYSYEIDSHYLDKAVELVMNSCLVEY